MCVCVYIYIYIYIKLDVILLDQKLHVSAGSGHHQVLSFDALKIILHNSRGGVFDEEISTSKLLLGHSTSILDVWVKIGMNFKWTGSHVLDCFILLRKE